MGTPPIVEIPLPTLGGSFITHTHTHQGHTQKFQSGGLVTMARRVSDK